MRPISRLSSLAGASVVAALALPMAAHAASNPFYAVDIAGYQVAEADTAKPEGKCGEAKCGAKKKAEQEAKAKAAEGKCGGDKADAKAAEGKCGEGKCGGKK